MSLRWSMHRYLLGQSLSFFHNDFAGRIVTKLMQTALAVREVVTKICDLMVYAVITAAGAIILAVSGNLILGIPITLWLIVYIFIVRHFVPKLHAISEEQSDARSTMTGHIVDAYTNISTLKLFSQRAREESYAKRSMSVFLNTAYKQGRLITLLTVCLDTSGYLCIFSTAVLSMYLWDYNLVSAGDIAATLALLLRLRGMSHWILWEIASVSEQLGTIRDGIGTLSKAQAVIDAPDATVLDESKTPDAPAIEFKNIIFHYGKKKNVIEDLSFSIHKGEKVGLVGRSGAGKSTIVNLLLRLYDLEDGKIQIFGQDISKGNPRIS